MQVKKEISLSEFKEDINQWFGAKCKCKLCFLLTNNKRNISQIRTAQKMKFSIKDFFSKCDQIRMKLRIWSHLLKKSLMKNFIFCAVTLAQS